MKQKKTVVEIAFIFTASNENRTDTKISEINILSSSHNILVDSIFLIF